MIDWQRVEELYSEIGPEDFVEVVILFLAEVEEALTRIMGGSTQLEEDLHFLKGSAWNLGFASFANLCLEGERRVVAGLAAEVDLAALEADYVRSKEEFLNGAGPYLSAA